MPSAHIFCETKHDTTLKNH
uniref:Uncharacterized protein n=1 Tax=Arundo donax TaxID=35708 RepID=A0A0A8YZT7_ARUDO